MNTEVMISQPTAAQNSWVLITPWDNQKKTWSVLTGSESTRTTPHMHNTQTPAHTNLQHTHTHTPHTHVQIHSHTHTDRLTHTYRQTLSLTHTESHTDRLSLTHRHTHTQTLSHTHRLMHTHRLTHSMVNGGQQDCNFPQWLCRFAQNTLVVFYTFISQKSENTQPYQDLIAKESCLLCFTNHK